MEKAFLCVAILKHGPQSLPYSSHQDTGSMPSPGIWALWLEDQWNMAEVMQHRGQAQVLRNRELLLSVPWNGPGWEPRLQAVRKFKPHAEILCWCSGQQPIRGPRWQYQWADLRVKKPSADSSPTTMWPHSMTEPEPKPLAEPSQPPEP